MPAGGMEKIVAYAVTEDASAKSWIEELAESME